MTTNHTELCERLRTEIEAFRKAGIDPGELVPALAHIEELELEREQAVAEAHGYRDRIAELEKERDALIHDNAQLVKAANAEATLASEALAERDALKVDAGRWRIIESTLPTDELQDIAIIVAAEHSVNVANGFSKAPADLLDAAVAALQAEKETR